MSQPSQQMGPPYASKMAGLGGMPTVGLDVPICAAFLVIFLGGAVSNMTILQLNRRRGHKFLMSGLMFGFCMARIATQVMRIVWACYPHNVRIAIAAGIFVSAGVLLLFLINLIFAQRIVRAAHPHFGWHKAFSMFFKALYALILIILAVVITATVQSFYTLNTSIHRIDRDLQLAAGSYLMLISFLPIPLVIFGIAFPRQQRLEKFGSGRWRTKIAILLTSSVLLCLGAAFRTGTQFKNPRPATDPAWYQAKWCFYFFNFGIEAIVIYLYLILRVDLRFHIPDGAEGPGDYYPDLKPDPTEKDDSRPRTSGSSRRRILTEEEVFDDQSPDASKKSYDMEDQRYLGFIGRPPSHFSH